MGKMKELFVAIEQDADTPEIIDVVEKNELPGMARVLREFLSAAQRENEQLKEQNEELKAENEKLKAGDEMEEYKRQGLTED